MCNDNIDIVNRICNIVPIWAFQFPGNQPVIDSNFTININDQYITYNLRGVIYFGDHHYTSGMINKVLDFPCAGPHTSRTAFVLSGGNSLTNA